MDLSIFLLGIIAAIVANMTGTGGGIVFFPVFILLGLPPVEATATSILIQAFGMSSGSISWLIYFKKHYRVIKLILTFVLFASLSAIIGAYSYIFLLKNSHVNIHFIFRAFSLCMAIVLIYTYVKGSTKYYKIKKDNLDLLFIVFVSFFGGILTAAISIGAGEFLVVLLMIRRYQADLAIACGVMVSAITVIAMTPYVTFYAGEVNYSIALNAIPGVLIGGYVARYIAKAMKMNYLKLFFICWLILSSLF